MRAVLARRPFRRLLAAQFTSQLGDGLYQIALASILIFDVAAARTPAQVTKVLAVTVLPFSLVGPFTGPFIDRLSRRSILVGASIVRTVTTLALVPALAGPEWILLTLAVVNISVNRFFHATRGASVPTLVAPRQLLTANTVSATGGMVTSLFGAVIGGPVADLYSPVVVVLAAAACMAVAGGLAARIPLPPGRRKGLGGLREDLRRNLADVADGLRTLRHSPRASYGVATVWTMRALLGFVLIAALVLLRARFDARAAGFSAVLGVVGVGGFVGAVAVPLVARRLGHAGIAPLALLVAGIVALALVPFPTWPTILGATLVAGVAMSMTRIASDTLVQSGVPDRYRGRAFSVYDIGYNGAFLLAALIPTLVLPVVGDVGVIVLTAALAVVGALLLGAWKRRIPPAVHVEAYAGGRADERPRRVALDGVDHDVAEVERQWEEDRDGRRLRAFRIRLADGRRLTVTTDGDAWEAEPLR